MRAILPICLAFLAGCAAAPDPDPVPAGFDYAPLLSRMVAAGLYRQDAAAPDLPVDDATLARNFLTIALRRERLGQQAARAIPLWRWEGPIRFSVEGDQATPADRAAIAAYFERLSRITGVPVAEDAAEPNFRIFILDGPGRRATGRRLAAGDDDWTGVAEFVGRMDGWDIPCRGSGRPGPGDRIERVVVLIKAEVVPPLRRSCIEEEIAQGFGLINDDDAVRPSLFNDRNEFGVLTDHDAMLLRILYHPRLRPGMTAAEVAPLLPRILADLRGAGA